VVAPGAFTPPAPARWRRGTREGAGGLPPLYASLPSFCRVEAMLRRATRTSRSKCGYLHRDGMASFKRWETAAGPPCRTALAQRWPRAMRASTDTGHSGNSGAFALGHPEKLIDFGYRAVHEMTVQAKASSTPSTARRPRVLLERMFAGRAPGNHGSAALPCRLRRDYRRRASRQRMRLQRANGDESQLRDDELHPA
jgi:hypothetical protein